MYITRGESMVTKYATTHGCSVKMFLRMLPRSALNHSPKFVCVIPSGPPCRARSFPLGVETRV